VHCSSSSKRHLQAVARSVEQASTLLRVGQQQTAGSRLVDDPTAGCQVAAAAAVAAAPVAVKDQQQQDLSCLVQQSCMEDERQQHLLQQQQQQQQQHSHIQHTVLQQRSVQLSPHWALHQPDLAHTQQDQQQALLLQHRQQERLSQGPAEGALHDAVQVDSPQETSSCSSSSLPEQQQHSTLQQGQQVDSLGLQELQRHSQQLGQDNPMQQQQPAPQQPVAEQHHQLVLQQQQGSNLQQQRQQQAKQPRQKLGPQQQQWQTHQQQQQKQPHRQPGQQQQQRNRPSSQSVREFRVANSTQPADLANALRLWLKQHDTQQHSTGKQQSPSSRPSAAASAAASSHRGRSSSSSKGRSSAGGGGVAADMQGVPDVLVCCSSKAALHTALQAVGLASHQASSLQRPYQLLLQPQVLHQALPVPAADPAAPAAGFLAQYQLRLSWVPSQPQAAQLQPQQQRPQQRQGQQQQQQQQGQQQQQQQGCQLQGGASRVDVSMLLQSQHCRLLQCDHLVSPSSSSSSSSSSRKTKSKKRKQPKAATSTATAAEGTIPAQPAVDQDSSSASSSSSSTCQQQQPAPCAPADSLYQLEWQLLGLLQGNWPTGLLCSTSVGALAAVKALVGASRHLAAGGRELFVAVQAADCGAPTADAAGAVQAGATGGDSSSSSGVVLWAVAAASSNTARPCGVTTPLTATEHQLLARTRSKQQQRMQQQQGDLQAGMGGQDYQQRVQQEHLLSQQQQQQQQVLSSPLPSTAASGQPQQQQHSMQQQPEAPVLRQQAAWPIEQHHGSIQLPARISNTHAVGDAAAAAVPAVDAASLHHIAESAVSSGWGHAPSAAVAAATPPEQLQPLC